MTLLTLFSQFKNKWWAKREASLKEEFAQKEEALLRDLVHKEHEVMEEVESRRAVLERERESLMKLAKENEHYEKLVEDRRVDLERSHAELKEQIRITEAKARPDTIWTSAFSSGFNAAWNMMMPLMSEGFNRMKDKVRNDAIEGSIRNFNDTVESAVSKRMSKAEESSLRSIGEINVKLRDLEERLKIATEPEERLQLKNYINALNWIIDGNILPKT